MPIVVDVASCVREVGVPSGVVVEVGVVVVGLSVVRGVADNC